MAGSWVVSLRRNVLDAVDALHPRQGARVIIHTGVLGITSGVYRLLLRDKHAVWNNHLEDRVYLNNVNNQLNIEALVALVASLVTGKIYKRKRARARRGEKISPGG